VRATQGRFNASDSDTCITKGWVGVVADEGHVCVCVVTDEGHVCVCVVTDEGHVCVVGSPDVPVVIRVEPFEDPNDRIKHPILHRDGRRDGRVRVVDAILLREWVDCKDARE
jgi:hypothetical protein